FFQAEDGIRDRNVTGVQTCALPIYRTATATAPKEGIVSMKRTANTYHQAAQSAPKGKWRTLDVAPASKNRHISFSGRNTNPALRSEERRVGQECRRGGR